LNARMRTGHRPAPVPVPGPSVTSSLVARTDLVQPGGPAPRMEVDGTGTPVRLSGGWRKPGCRRPARWPSGLASPSGCGPTPTWGPSTGRCTKRSGAWAWRQSVKKPGAPTSLNVGLTGRDLMINGDRCTRACGFCQVDTSKPLPSTRTSPGAWPKRLQPGTGGMQSSPVSPAMTWRTVGHRVLLPPSMPSVSGARGQLWRSSFRTARATRCPGTDFRTPPRRAQPQCGDRAAAPAGGTAVSFLHPEPGRPGRAVAAGLTAKSGLMLGLGEEEDEVLGALSDLHAIGVSIVTIGQYLGLPSTICP